MEIVVKTAAEFRDAHVTIEIRADQAEMPEISRRLTGAEAVNRKWAERAGKVPALEAQVRELRDELNGVRGSSEGLEDRIQDLVAERDALLLKGEADRAADHDLVIAARAERDAEKERADNMEAERDALLLRVREYDSDRKTEKQRADENRAWAERTEDRLETRTRELDKATKELARIQDKVWKDTLDHAMNHRGNPESISIETVGDLVYAVSAVRSIVGQP